MQHHSWTTILYCFGLSVVPEPAGLHLVYTSSVFLKLFLSVCSLKCDVVMRHTPLAIAVSSMHFSLKWHRILEHMPGGLLWYTQYMVSEQQIFGQIP